MIHLNCSLKINTPHDGEILFDYSKNRIDSEVLRLLFDLAKDRKVAEARNLMFSGAKINFTENRAVLHTALRHAGSDPVLVDGKDVVPDVSGVLDHMKAFTLEVHTGQWLG